jgi:hypothetical protein
MGPPKTLKTSNHQIFDTPKLNGKLSIEMKLEEEGLKWDPSQL